MKFRRFTKPKFLKQVGRPLLERLFEQFTDELAAKNVVMPKADAEDDAYFKALAEVVMAPEGLPDDLIEALFAIEEMANEQGQERLETAARQMNLDLRFDQDSSCGDIAVQVWLAKPELLHEKHNELRIHASTKGERKLYQRVFGIRLFGDDKHFSERKAYTLEPLCQDGEAALDTSDIEKINRIVLVEIEVFFGGKFKEVVIRKAEDILAAAKERGQEGVPPKGHLVRATFEVYFTGAKKPRKVQLRPPNILKLGRYCDAVAVQRWLSVRRFRENTE